jgi:exonuclease SbcC
MKPIKLILSAFGPYKDQAEIDFEKIGDSGIFLITGDTGSGKTTIFDAISFALFGEVSGSNRPVSSLRSNFAEVEKETFVELVFSHKQKIYKLHRNPPYERIKKRGEGTTLIDADAWLDCDKETITGHNAVTTKVQEILGINAKQFKQIAMLAQRRILKNPIC